MKEDDDTNGEDDDEYDDASGDNDEVGNSKDYYSDIDKSANSYNG